jgi:hypothetical protein
MGWEFGMGREWGGDGEEGVSLQATLDQGGQDSTTQEEGFQVSDRELARGISKGDQ